MSLAIVITPSGRLSAESAAPAEPALSAAAAARLAEALGASSAAGHLHALFHSPNAGAETLPLQPTDTDWPRAFAEEAPPMKGLEYLNGPVLAQLWAELEAHARGRLAASKLLFLLRGVDPAGLISQAAAAQAVTDADGPVMSDSDLTEIFGIELEAEAKKPEPKKSVRASAKRPAAGKNKKTVPARRPRRPARDASK